LLFDAVPADLAPLFAEACRRLGADHLVTDRTVIDPPTTDPWPAPSEHVVAALHAASAPVVLAGPGVVRDGAVPGLHALAVAGSVGVLNTWGAKGVFDWRSRHHLATVGLQARDFELGGMADADLIIATGVDERETGGRWRLAPVLEVPPRALDPLAEQWSRPRAAIAVPALRIELARVTQAGWARDDVPLCPTRVTRHYGTVLGGGGLVAADPGVAGFWVARTLGTTGVGGVQVPADASARGFAVACATVARLVAPGRAVLAVVDALDDVHERLLAIAAGLGIAVPVEVWSGDGAVIEADEHLRRLRSLVESGGRTSVATDAGQLDEMIAVAGEIVAWTHSPGRSARTRWPA
jgi:acetolactate synthase I/II/III large subunit